MDRQNSRTNGKSKAIQTKSHTDAYTYTLTKREKGEYIYIALLPKSTSSIWDDLLSVQVFHRCRVHQVDCGYLIHCSWGCWEKFPFLFFAQLLGFSFGFGPTSVCRLPEGVCSLLRQDKVKGAADSGALAHSGRGEGGVWSAGQACGGRGHHDVATAWDMLCVLPGKLSLDHRTLAVVGCTVSHEGRCGQWPMLAHRLFGGNSSSLSVSCLSLGSVLLTASHACLWSSFKQCS